MRQDLKKSLDDFLRQINVDMFDIQGRQKLYVQGENLLNQRRMSSKEHKEVAKYLKTRLGIPK